MTTTAVVTARYPIHRDPSIRSGEHRASIKPMARAMVLGALLALSNLSWSAICDGTNNGATCDDGNACTQVDICQAGVCVGSNPVVCGALDQCHVAGTCNPSTGACSNPAKADGSMCTDGNACTQTDTCQAGTCVSANPVVCAAPDQCHVAGTCDTSTGVCSNPAKADGSMCTDGNACTQSDTCQAGTCVSSNPVVCAAPDQCHDVGFCNPSTGACSNPAKADGSMCTDGNACTQADACQAGTCVGANPVTCAALDACHKAGTCDSSTGVCSNPLSESCPGCAIVLDGTSVVYTAFDGTGIFKSIDQGGTWSVATTQPSNLRIKALARRNSSVLYAGTYGAGIYVSSDSGNTWASCTGQPSDANVTALAIDANGNLYAGTEGGLFRSADACAHWTAINTNLPLNPLRPPLSIVIDPATPATIYAGFYGAGIFKSINSGTSWTAATVQPTDLNVRALALRDASTLYAATQNSGAFKSIDAGQSWAACTGQPSNPHLLSLAINAAGALYAGSGTGVFQSTDGCATWAALNNGLPP